MLDHCAICGCCQVDSSTILIYDKNWAHICAQSWIPVNGDGISTVIAAIPYFKDGNKEQPKQAWKYLLGSGSDGNLIFIRKRALRNIPNSKRYVPVS